MAKVEGADGSSPLEAVRELNMVDIIECVCELTTRSRGEGRMIRFKDKDGPCRNLGCSSATIFTVSSDSCFIDVPYGVSALANTIICIVSSESEIQQVVYSTHASRRRE